MPYTRITGARHGREALEYALDGKGHNGNEIRNLAVATVGLCDNCGLSYADQMQVYWNLASAKNKNQVRRIVTSYSKDELDPNDPNSPIIASQIAMEHAKRYYPDRQVVICVQADGVGGCIHTHEIISNVSVTDYRGCTDEQTKFHYVAKTVDEVASEFIELSMGLADKFDEKNMKVKIPADIVKQNERRQREANEKAIKNGEKPPHYIWKDDLKSRIKQAMSEATSETDFFKRLTANGVEATPKYSKKQGDYILYELVDLTGFEDKIPRNLKSKSYKMGSDYGIEALSDILSMRRTRFEPVYDAPAPAPIPIIEQKTEEEKKYTSDSQQKATETTFESKSILNTTPQTTALKTANSEAKQTRKEKLVNDIRKDAEILQTTSKASDRIRGSYKRRGDEFTNYQTTANNDKEYGE